MQAAPGGTWEFSENRGGGGEGAPYFGVLIIRIPLFRVITILGFLSFWATFFCGPPTQAEMVVGAESRP